MPWQSSQEAALHAPAWVSGHCLAVSGRGGQPTTQPPMPPRVPLPRPPWRGEEDPDDTCLPTTSGPSTFLLRALPILPSPPQPPSGAPRFTKLSLLFKAPSAVRPPPGAHPPDLGCHFLEKMERMSHFGVASSLHWVSHERLDCHCSFDLS